MMNQPKISFITVCYNTPNLIRVLLRGVEQTGFSFPYEYFLVDNGNDGTADMVRERFPWVIVIRPGENTGFAKGNNMAIKMAQGEYVMLINPDLVLFQGEVEKLLAAAEAHPNTAILGPRVERPDGLRQRTCTRLPTLGIPAYKRTFLGKLPMGRKALAHFEMEDTDHDRAHEPDTLYGAALLIRTKAFNDIGILDERFFMYYEDMDLCRRAWKQGWRVLYVPDARVVHYHQRESLIRYPWELFTNRLVRIHIASGIKYFWKYRNEPHPRARISEGHEQTR